MKKIIIMIISTISFFSIEAITTIINRTGRYPIRLKVSYSEDCIADNDTNNDQSTSAKFKVILPAEKSIDISGTNSQSRKSGWCNKDIVTVKAIIMLDDSTELSKIWTNDQISKKSNWSIRFDPRPGQGLILY